MTVTVRPISASAHLAVIAARGSASFLQTPAWGAVKSEWRSQSLGFFRDRQSTPFGAGLVLYRKVPRLRPLPGLPARGPGPRLGGAWTRPRSASRWPPLVAHVKGQAAFGLRIGPPVVTRRWSAATVKDGDQRGRRTAPARPAARRDHAGRAPGRRRAGPGSGSGRPREDGGFAVGQPRYVFQVPLAGRTDDELLAGFNQLWRRNIRKADKAGVEVRQGGLDDLGGVPPALRRDRRARRVHPPAAGATSRACGRR